MGRIVDLSQGGVSVEYTSDSKLRPSAVVEVDIFTSPTGIRLSRVPLPCEIVYDQQLFDMPSMMGLETRRCDLQSKGLSEERFRQVESVLSRSTVQDRESSLRAS